MYSQWLYFQNSSLPRRHRCSSCALASGKNTEIARTNHLISRLIIICMRISPDQGRSSREGYRMSGPFSRLCGIFNGFHPPTQAIDFHEVWEDMQPYTGPLARQWIQPGQGSRQLHGRSMPQSSFRLCSPPFHRYVVAYVITMVIQHV